MIEHCHQLPEEISKHISNRKRTWGHLSLTDCGVLCRHLTYLGYQMETKQLALNQCPTDYMVLAFRVICGNWQIELRENSGPKVCSHQCLLVHPLLVTVHKNLWSLYQTLWGPSKRRVGSIAASLVLKSNLSFH